MATRKQIEQRRANGLKVLKLYGREHFVELARKSPATKSVKEEMEHNWKRHLNEKEKSSWDSEDHRWAARLKESHKKHFKGGSYDSRAALDSSQGEV